VIGRGGIAPTQRGSQSYLDRRLTYTHGDGPRWRDAVIATRVAAKQQYRHAAWIDPGPRQVWKNPFLGLHAKW
jgi:hypothetical protein